MKKITNNKVYWKETADKYLIELEKFLDLVDNIKDEELKERIILQMLRIDNELTKEAERIFEELKMK